MAGLFGFVLDPGKSPFSGLDPWASLCIMRPFARIPATVVLATLFKNLQPIGVGTLVGALMAVCLGLGASLVAGALRLGGSEIEVLARMEVKVWSQAHLGLRGKSFTVNSLASFCMD